MPANEWTDAAFNQFMERAKDPKFAQFLADLLKPTPAIERMIDDHLVSLGWEPEELVR